MINKPFTAAALAAVCALGLSRRSPGQAVWFRVVASP